MEIEELVEKAKSGDKDAYAKLIAEVENDLYNIARSRLDNPEDCKDVVQDTIINAYLGINKLKNPKTFRSWINKILINECNHIYHRDKKKSEIDEKYVIASKTVDYLDDNLDFDNIVDSLNDKEKSIFKLFYEDELSIKQIANRLNMNENTIKTILSRGKQKIRRSYKPATIFTFILCILVATSVIAVSIISYIKSLFELNSVGIENAGVLMAIEHLDWFQETDMDYIDLSDGYKVRVDYLLMDEMNLYLVFDISSEEDISRFTDVYFENIKITDENGNIICDKSNIFSEQASKFLSTKLIENSNNNIKVLLYMYTDDFPESKSLSISFSEIYLSKKLKETKVIDNDVNFTLNLSEKFINRNYVTYTSDNPNVEKAIITETGFYAIVNKNENIKIKTAKLVDENGIEYDCYFNYITDSNTNSNFKYILYSNFNDKNSKNLKLILNKEEYYLKN